MDIDRRQRAFAAFDRATELPMLVLALSIIPLLLLPLLLDLPERVDDVLFALE
jgi:hypothetical protein